MKPRFSLRTLFVVMTLIAALFGWRWFNYRRAQNLIAEINGKGPQPVMVSQSSDGQQSDGKSYRAGETVSTATIDTTGSWRRWWFPSVVVVNKGFIGLSGIEYIHEFPQGIVGFGKPKALSQKQDETIPRVLESVLSIWHEQ